MDKKLTLSLDNTIIEEAKKYAKSNNISLSKLIEAYLATLTKRKNSSTAITPLVESLTGVISLDEKFDEKAAFANYLMEKYKWLGY